MLSNCQLISKSLAAVWRQNVAGLERHPSEGAHRFVLVTNDSEKPFKGYSEKIGLCNYRDLCLLQFQEVHCYPQALGTEESTEEKCNVIFGWRLYDHTHKVNKVTSINVWLGENKATRPLEKVETAGRASAWQITLVCRKSHQSWEPVTTFYFILFP